MPETSAPRALANARIETILVIAFIVVAIATQVWQPFVLGFYHDDWPLFPQLHLHPADATWFGAPAYDRPGYEILLKLIVEYWNGEPATLHLIKIALTLSTCAAMVWATVTYQRALGAFSPALAAFGAAFWVVAPWSLGYSLWTTAALAGHSVLLLCLAAIALHRWIETRAVLPLVGCLAADAASLFTYQSTWLAIFPFLMILALREYWHRRSLLPAVGAFVALVLVQATAAVHSLMLSPKATNPHVFSLAIENLRRTTRLGMDHFGHSGNKAMLIVVGLTTIAACIVLLRRGGAYRLRVVGVAVFFLSGIVATCAVYAAAGYELEYSGIFSRTTQMVNFWVGVGGPILFAPAIADAALDKFRYVGLGLASAIIAVCAAYYWPAARPWVRSWEMQRAILDKSRPLIERLQDDDAVLTDVPTKTDEVVVFSAPWDITAAVLTWNAGIRPDFSRRVPTVQIIPPVALPMSWTPGTFTFTPGWTLPAKRLLLWRWQTGVITTVDHPVASRDELIGLLAAP